MKISMSNHMNGLEVTVSVQAALPAARPFESALPLGMAGSFDENETLDRLQKTLNQALPGALCEADAEIRVAIAESYLSDEVEVPVETAVTEATGLQDPVYYGSGHLELQPSELGQRDRKALLFTEVVIIYGPEGCGKTRHAEQFREHFAADVVIDGDLQGLSIKKGQMHLLLTNAIIPEALATLFRSNTPIDCVRMLTFDAAMRELEG